MAAKKRTYVTKDHGSFTRATDREYTHIVVRVFGPEEDLPVFGYGTKKGQNVANDKRCMDINWCGRYDLAMKAQLRRLNDDLVGAKYHIAEIVEVI